MPSLNWLAHLALSPAHDPALRLGNVCADFFTLDERLALPPALRRGVDLHLSIDSFTDQHPVVARACARFPASHRRLAGLLVDVAFDHLLARDWSRWMGGSLNTFTREFYRETRRADDLPDHVRSTLALMAREDWLSGYATWFGVEMTLLRMSRRMSPRLARRCPIEPVPEILAGLLPDLATDFVLFWPELSKHCDSPCP
jgi:acyl carrier protein phosphodiesterase